jgi:UDP-N-acetylmuramate dehydrogenase
MSQRDRIGEIIERCRRDYPCDIEFRFDEPMSAHTTFKTGGPADCWLRPAGEGFPAFCAGLLREARAAGLPVFVLGGGANLVVADKGIRGLTLDTSGWSGLVPGAEREGETLRFCSGAAMDGAAEIAADAGLSGLEFLAGMPGSVGGGVWMNARCYDHEIADTLLEISYIDFEDQPRIQTPPVCRAEFGYKRSPFQNRRCLILSAAFQVTPGNQAEIRSRMREYRTDRARKGHYRYPCAGSVFRNNREFGRPVGKIIDELGLRGLRIGGAQIAPFHGNIIINSGGATAADIRALTLEAAARVKTATGFTLEPEILFVGEW